MAGSSPDEGPVMDARTLRRLFLDLLGRPPLEGERSEWGGRTRAALVETILPTEEFWQNWIEEQLYFFLLVDNFRPATEGVRALPGLLAQGKLGVREALHRICLSSSFERRNPGPDTFVSVVMEQVLGLTVQKTVRELEIGKRIYDGARGTFLGKPGNSQADLVHIAISDPRALHCFLEREHQRILRRPMPADLAEEWVARLEREELAFADILRGWLVSAEYERRLRSSLPQPNHMFVRALHVDLMGRPPDELETQRFRTALDGLSDATPLRSLLARLILDSGKVRLPERGAIADPAAWIRGQFERLMGRQPEGGELAVFLQAFEDPACRPATVLYAIVSHPEYQTW